MHFSNDGLHLRNTLDKRHSKYAVSRLETALIYRMIPELRAGLASQDKVNLALWELETLVTTHRRLCSCTQTANALHPEVLPLLVADVGDEFGEKGRKAKLSYQVTS